MQELPADVKQKKNIFLSAANDCDTKYFCRWRHLCFCPMRLVLILKGKDPLQRKFEAAAATYWTPRKPIQDVGQYRKQF